jgi:uncharacterized protein YjbI with pentapeptide repeats
MNHSSARTTILAVAVAVLIVALIPTLITWAPHWLASTVGLNADQRAAEVGRVRTALLALLAGGIAVVGAVYTARTFALNRQIYADARDQARLSHELDQARLATEQFTRAVDQLGSKQLDLRLGGIYALERVARESPNDHGPAMEILTAYVREHARRRPRNVREARGDDAPSRPTTDVQAVLTVFGRRVLDHDAGLTLDLSETVLSAISLPLGANLSGASFYAADLRSASLPTVDLQNSFFNHASLQSAHLVLANLRGASLAEANLHGAGLAAADLQGAKLQGADLSWAKLKEAKLAGAKLAGANLVKADLEMANFKAATYDDGTKFEAATYDDATIWPEGFDPTSVGARRLVS